MKGRALIPGIVTILAIVSITIPAIAQDKQAEQNKQTEDPIAVLRKLLQEHPEAIPALRALLDQLEKGKVPQPGQKPVDEPDIPGVVLPGAAEKPEGGQ